MRRKGDITKERGKSEEMMEKEAEFWDEQGVLDFASELDEPITIDSELREEVLSGKRKRKLKNISLKVDPVFIQAIKKIATQKAIPYQSLIRMWLAENIKQELRLT
ncbi:BrnA antitoxin family protein [bacterium]|nr:BrnA antitoxin family protein [bacterium]MBU1614320.1 BrnA antitoxin family protein [bacterium]